jgi:hypothetical protein
MMVTFTTLPVGGQLRKGLDLFRVTRFLVSKHVVYGTLIVKSVQLTSMSAYGVDVKMKKKKMYGLFNLCMQYVMTFLK